MLAKTSAGGLCTAFPDVCNTPTPGGPVPTPYPNTQPDTTNVGFVPHVLMTGTPAHNMSTVAPMSMGDNLGIGLGVVSPTVMGPIRTTTAAFTVIVGGMPLGRTTSVTMHNGTNAVGAKMVPSVTNVMVLAP